MDERSFFSQKQSLITYAASLLFTTLASVALPAIFPNGGDGYLYLSFALPQVFYLSCFFILAKVWKKDVKQVVWFKTKLTLKDILLTVGIAVGLFFFALLPVTAFTSLLAKLNLPSTVSIPATDNPLGAVLTILIICILPALGEELIFRGMLSSSFKGVGGFASCLLCGAIFSLSHLSTAQTLHQFFVGTFLALLYLKKKSIILPMAAHFINNILAVFAGYIIPPLNGAGLDAKGLTLLLPLCAGGLILLLGCGYFLFFGKKPLKQGVKEFIAEYPKRDKIEVTTFLWIGVLVIMLICVSLL